MIPTKLREKLFAGDAGAVFRGMIVLAMGTGMARLIGVASIPILTRIYSPSDYGTLAVFSSLVALVAPALTLRYVLAVPLPRTNQMAAALLVLSGITLLTTTLALIALLWVSKEALFGWLSMEVLLPWWWLAIAGGVVVAAYEALSLWATRQRAYRRIAQTKITQSLMGELTKLCLGLLGVKPLGLLIGSVVEQSGGSATLLVSFRRQIGSALRKVRRRHVQFAAWHYRGFPGYRLPSQFLLVFSTQAPAMFSAALFGASATGQLGLALMALALPTNLIGQSVGQAFYGEIARLKKGSYTRLKTLVYTVQKRLFMVGVPVAVSIVILGPYAFELVFGPEWSVAGTYAAILAPYVLLQLTSAPLVQVLNVLNAQRSFLLINAVRTLGLLAIYYFTSRLELTHKSFVSTISFFLFAFYLSVSAYIIYVVRKSSDSQGKG